jgi:hypothetical protein
MTDDTLWQSRLSSADERKSPKLLRANAPRSYDPQDIPEELVQTQPRAKQWLSWIQS